MGLPGARRALQRITGIDLGFTVIDPATGAMTIDVVIPKNTSIPIERTSTYFSNRADQKRIIVEIMQATDSPTSPASLGHFAFVLERPRKNHPLQVVLGYDANGLVTVKARDPDTKQEVQPAFEGLPQRDRARSADQAQLVQCTRLIE
jgi:molecular chaperone DnaK